LAAPCSRPCSAVPSSRAPEQGKKAEFAAKHGRAETDTGHGKDHHSRRGLLTTVGKRGRLLRYFEKHDLEKQAALVAEHGLRQ
jgi:hypothetical protein